MTEDEKRFAALISNYEAAFANHSTLSSSLPPEPTYQQSDYYRPNEMAAFKRQEAEYKQAKSEADAAKQKAKEASDALDEWIPAFVRERLRMGGQILAPVPEGHIALRKATGTYVVIKGKDEQDVVKRAQEHAQRYQQGWR